MKMMILQKYWAYCSVKDDTKSILNKPIKTNIQTEQDSNKTIMKL